MLENLETYDVKILNYINKHTKVHINEIMKKYPDKKYSTKYRLDCLSEQNYSRHYNGRIQLPIDNTSYLNKEYVHLEDKKTKVTSSEFTGYYYVSDLGKKFLQNYKTTSREKHMSEFIRSFFFPMLIAFLTTLLTIWITSLIQSL
ncbi:hypothetical protein ABID14_000257 [Peptoniphilus olsenii]|uniref:Uncharacterized protein n=1 Tax=Peptoniphilus olsenii TaxID=411570 RepID=A0ABV2J779_9FIRM